MSRRPLWIAGAGLPLAALALWASSRLAWSTGTRQVPGTGATTTVTRTGAEVAPLVGLALLALAGLAAAVALGGWPRRVVGGVLMAGGVTAMSYAIGYTDPAGAFLAGRWLAVAGGVLLLLAGAVLALRPGGLPRLGARYRAPGATREPDNVDGDMWQALSVGKDPTTEEH
ncbi:Trp biosynthesis-associated membrane protein [Actinophytocola sp.]|uniref:Trp biosynthesis-associated membrane protein n=1 Tax=Actinophytocola sp. TaxID=1872138 RepID=UPI002D7E71C5|nr:Trp biosynthesis-associated membrane protein [Actinophytocola sp.]HET9138950.1 Trp biosynthesis-associated membrane protein [Actinophytocola sp.]